jgi:hypothetical protein
MLFLDPDTQFLRSSPSQAGKHLNRRKGMVLHVQWSTNCGLGAFGNINIFFHCTSSQFYSGLMTAQALDSLPLYRYSPVINKVKAA